MEDSTIGWATEIFTPSSYVHGPVPPRPSRVGRLVTAGTVVVGKRLHGHTEVVVVNVQLTGPAIAVPSAAATVAARRAVYVAPTASGAVGCRVPVFDAASYDTVAPTCVEPVVRVNAAPLIVAASMSRENVALTA